MGTPQAGSLLYIKGGKSMPQYLSPGVYVEEVPSAVKAIAGVGTSTAGFIGVVPDTIDQPLSQLKGVLIGRATRPKRISICPSIPSTQPNPKSKSMGLTQPA
jgi:phage tail sheath protein FI